MGKLVGGKGAVGTGADVGGAVSEDIKVPDIEVGAPGAEQGTEESSSSVRRPAEVVNEVFSERPQQSGSILDRVGNVIGEKLKPIEAPKPATQEQAEDTDNQRQEEERPEDLAPKVTEGTQDEQAPSGADEAQNAQLEEKPRTNALTTEIITQEEQEDTEETKRDEGTVGQTDEPISPQELNKDMSNNKRHQDLAMSMAANQATSESSETEEAEEAREPVKQTVPQSSVVPRTVETVIKDTVAKQHSGKKGAAVTGQLSSDPMLGLDEISIGDEILAQDWTVATSPLPGIILKEAEKMQLYVDPEQMATDVEYRKDIITQVLEKSRCELLVTKHPVPNDNSSHVMTIMVHKGRDVHTNPIITKVFNMDFDGDTTGVAFDIGAVERGRARTTADYLVSHVGDIGIDTDAFGYFPWGERQKKLIEAALKPYGLTPKLIDEINKAWTKMATAEDIENEFKKFIKVVDSVASRFVAYTNENDEKLTLLTRGQLLCGIIQTLHIENNKVMKYYIGMNADNASDKAFRSLGYSKEAYQSAPLIDDPTIVDGREWPFRGMLTDGELPHDFAELAEALHIEWKKVKEEDGKTVNLYFRVPAGVAKEIRRSKDIQVGTSPTGDNAAITDGTIYGLLSAAMSSISVTEDTILESTTEARQAIVSLAKMPKNFDNLGDFLKHFAEVNNLVAYEFNAGSTIVDAQFNIRQRTNMTIREIKSNPKYYLDVRQAFLQCYGQFTIRTIFGPKAAEIPAFAAWLDVPLADWARDDYVDRLETFGGKKEIGGQKTGQEQLAAFAASMLAQRNSSASTFNKELEALMESISTNIKGTDTYAGVFDAMQETMMALGGEAFIRRGYGSPEAFRKSEFLKRLQRTRRDPDKMIGAIYTELAEDMFSNILTRYDTVLKLRELWVKEEDPIKKIAIENKMRKASLDVFNEVREVAKTNILWKNVATEWYLRKFNGNYYPKENPGKSFYEKVLIQEKGRKAKEMALKDLFNMMHASGDSPSVVSWKANPKEERGGHWEPSEAWPWNSTQDWGPSTVKRRDDSRKVSLLDQFGNPHTSITNTYVFTEMMFGKLNKFNAGVNRTFAGKNTALENVRAAKRFADNLKLRSYTEIKANVSSTLDQLIRENNGNENAVEAIIENHIERSAPVLVDKRLLFGCLEMDLVYGNSEKAKTSRAANVIFQVANLVKNGSVMSDAERFFDAAMDQMEINDFSRNVTVIRHLLAHPDQSITVYDPVNMTKKAVNKEVLLGGKSYIKALRENPMLAMMLRNHSVNVSAISDSHDSVTIKASNTLYGSLTKGLFSDEALDNAIVEFIDNPYFYAFAKCFNAKNPETKVRMALTAIADFKRSELSIEKWMEKTFPKPKTKGEEDVYNDLKRDIPGYAERLEDWNQIEDGWNQSFEYTANYYALRNLLSTAKTQTSTGVNGATTYRINAPLTFLATYTAPACNAPARQISAKDFFDDNEDTRDSWRNFIGAVTDTGWIIDETSLERIKKESNGETVGVFHPADCTSPGCPCHHHSIADQSSNNQPNMQSTALGRFLQVFRDKGTEALNLKIAKVGDDNKDSISKLSRFNSDGWSKIARTIKDDAKKNLPQARIELANWLKQVSMDLGYDMLRDLDYVNIAQIMIRQLPDGSFDVLSIQQISQLQRNIMFNYLDTIDNKKKITTQELGQVCDEALANFQGYGELATEEIMRRLNPSPLFQYGERNKAGDVLARVEEKYVNQSEQPWLSSAPRNRQFLRKIMSHLASINQPVNTAVTDSERRASGLKLLDSIDEEKLFTRGFSSSIRRAAKGYDGYVLSMTVTKEGKSFINNPGAGQRVLVAISSDASSEDIEYAMAWAWNRGATVVFDREDFDPARILAGMRSQNNLTKFAIQSAHNGAMGYTVSWADIIMNQRMPNENGTVAIGTNLYNDDQLSFVSYDPHNEHMLGDAEGQIYKSMVDKTRIRKGDTQSIDVYDVFAESLSDAQSLQTATVSFPTADEILSLFVENEGEKCVLDPGANKTQKIEEQLAQYLDRFLKSHNDNGFLTETTVSVGDIVGLCKLNRNGEVVWGVIRAFDLIGGKSGPAFMNVANIRLNNATQSIDFDWNIDVGLLDENGNVRSAKVFEGINAFNKYVLRSKLPEHGEYRELEDGTPLDMTVAEYSVGSRLTSEQRVKEKLNTLTVLSQRKNHGYNIADMEGFMPGLDELKMMIASGQIDLNGWSALLYDENGNPSNLQIMPETYDAKANALICNTLRNFLDARINPSLFLCSYFKTPEGNLRHHIMPPRWSDLYDNGPQATDALMQFFHAAVPDICPDGLHGDPAGCLMNNQLQLYVPFYGYDAEGQVVKKGFWSDVAVSQVFFDEHVDVLRRPSVKSNANSILTAVSRRSMGQPIAKNQILDLVDYATAKFAPGEIPNSISTGDPEANEDSLPEHIDEQNIATGKTSEVQQNQEDTVDSESKAKVDTVKSKTKWTFGAVD